MAQVDITINGRNYKVACDDGQEEHLSSLGSFVNGRVKELTDAVGQIGDSRLLVMACLLISDELGEAQRQLQESEAAASASAPAEPIAVSFDEDELAEGIEAVAERIEGIAERMERA